MENYMRSRLRDKSISDLKVILEYCKEKAKTDTNGGCMACLAYTELSFTTNLAAK